MKKLILLCFSLSSFAHAGIRMDCNISEKSVKNGPPQKLSVEYSDQWYFQANGKNVAEFELTQSGKSIFLRYEDYNAQRDLQEAKVEMHCATSVGGYAEWSTKHISSTPDSATYYCKCM